MVRVPGPSRHQTQRGFTSMKPAPAPDALNKITALEAELLKLRAQIAMIVTVPPTTGTLINSSNFHKNMKHSANEASFLCPFHC